MPKSLRWLMLAGVLACVAFAAPTRVEYILTPLLEGGALTSVQVDLTFRGQRSGETPLELPSEWGGQRELWRGIVDLQVVSGATMSDGADAWHRVLHHRPDAAIHVRYRVIQDRQGDPQAEQGNAYRPVIRPTYFHLIGNAFIVEPGVDENLPARVRVSGLPRGWSFASDLEHPGLTLGHTQQSVTVGGDFRIVRGADPRIRVALRGRWSFSDADLAERVNTIIAGERAFWGDRSASYLVTVMQLSAPNANWLSIGGTGLEDAFAFFASPSVDLRQITRTLAHEGIHTWIPTQVGRMPDHDEATDYWLSEGFTDFYTGRILVREGVWTPADYAADFNEMLSAYAQSSVRAEPNTRVVADFWNNQEVGKLPYQRGRMLASIWDARLRARGHSLDEVMHVMRTRARSADHPHAATVFATVMNEMSVNVSGDVARYVERGEPIAMPDDVFAPCGTLATRTAPVFSRGFDIEATQAHNNVISGVDPDLPAYAAGLRDGMVLVRRDHGAIGDAEQEIAYVVRDGPTERTIAYMPRGHGSFTTQTLTIDPHLAGDQFTRCTATLAGP
jgi:predicted metalloprotease with PDZ domain